MVANLALPVTFYLFTFCSKRCFCLKGHGTSGRVTVVHDVMTASISAYTALTQSRFLGSANPISLFQKTPA